MGNDEKKEITAIDALLDPSNKEPIVLYREDGQEDVFEQVAITNVGGALYAILKPQIPLEGMGDDEALVFAIEENDEGDLSMLLVTDSAVVDAAFEDYYNLLREAGYEI